MIDGVIARWAPLIIEAVIKIVDRELILLVLKQAIDRTKARIERSEAEWDDRIILPLLETIENLAYEKEGP